MQSRCPMRLQGQWPTRPQHISRGKIIRVASWGIFEACLLLAYGIISTPVVAVLLGPYDLGKAGLVMALVTFVEILFALGIPEALIQARSVHTAIQASAHTALLILSLLGSALICISAGPIAVIYGDEQVQVLLIVAALLLPINAILAVPLAIMTRKLRAKVMSVRNMLARTAIFGVTVTLASCGFGAWSLVIGSIAGSSVSFAFMLSAVRRIPVVNPSLPDLRSLLSAGLFMGAESLIAASSYRLFVMLIAYVCGMSQVGYFQLGQRPVDELAAISQTLVQRFGAAYFANLKRRSQDARQIFLAATSVLAAVSFPMFGGLAVLAPDIAQLMLSPQWLPAVPVLQLCAISWMLACPAVLLQPLLRAEGRQPLVSAYMLITALVPSVVFLTLPTDPSLAAGVGWASRHLFAVPAAALGTWLFLRLPPRQFARPFINPLVACAAMLVGVEVWRGIIENLSLLRLASCVVVGAVLYGTALYLLARRGKMF
jgi:O-antigen/teichoic acid export membrane protein